MSASKELFLRSDKEAVSRAIALIKSSDFDRIVAFARAEFMEKNLPADQCVGANTFIATMRDLIEEPGEESDNLSSGLDHEMKIPNRSEPKPETKK